MGYIRHRHPGTEAAVARYVWGLGTFLAAGWVILLGVNTGSSNFVAAGVLIGVAGIIPWTRTRSNVGGVRGVLLHVLYFALLFIAVGVSGVAS